MALDPGTRLGPYEIVAPLGAGGMGEVYRARDTRLDRDVAIKVLPEHLGENEEAMKRLQREAKAVAALSHPNVVGIHDVGAEGGMFFVVMELLEGETLRQRLGGSPLPGRKALEIAEGISNGLAAGHAKGIIHRDIKPENIFLTSDGVVKILDFGLAGAEASESPTLVTSKMTKPGSILGTLHYMSPEQVQGEDVDVRSDIFSLGTVLYEMITGRRPFSGKTTAETMSAILRQEPPPPGESGVQPSAELVRVMTRCLEKKPGERFQSAKDLSFTLRAIPGDTATATAPTPVASSGSSYKLWGVGAGAALIALLAFIFWRGGLEPSTVQAGVIASLAVLPLENLSGDPAQQFFADGMTEALTADLAKISALRVISRTSAMRYKGPDRPPLPQIARELNVDAIIEGSVLHAGARVRITVQLIEASTDHNLWAESYEGDYADVLTLQSQVAKAIADEIRIQLTPEDERRLADVRTVVPEIHEDYLKGRALIQVNTRESLDQAREYFERVLEKDGQNALAYVGIAESYYFQSSYYLPPLDTMPFAKRAAERALMIDPTSAEALVARGLVKLQFDWDWEGAQEDFVHALELNGNSSEAHLGYAMYLQSHGRTDEALPELELSLELDPYSLATSMCVGIVYFMSGDHERMLEQYERAVKLKPDSGTAQMWLGAARCEMGQLEHGLIALEGARRLDDDSFISALLGWYYVQADREAEARRMLADMLEAREKTYVCPYEIATVYVALGEFDLAFEMFQLALREHANCIPWLKVDPRLDSIRSDPRYAKLVADSGRQP